jgi:signal peptidase I
MFDTLIIAAAIAVRAFLFQPFSIPSSSFAPTLLVGDYVFVSKFSYGYSRYSFPPGLLAFKGRVLAVRPNIVVFKLPSDGRTDYLKRVIGLPGDRIQMIDGDLNINGKSVERELITEYDEDEGGAEKRHVAVYRERLPGGVTHLIQRFPGDFSWQRLSNAGPYIVPPGQYFVMGDNRDNSVDSRIPSDRGGVGFVPLDNLEGRAQIIYFSVDQSPRARGKVRWSRMFQRIN